MLLTWMAFRGKFPRAEPLHFLDADLNEVAYGHGCWGRVILWSSGSPVQSGIPLAESHQPSCKSFIAEGTDSSSIAGRIGRFLQVAPIESAAA